MRYILRLGKRTCFSAANTRKALPPLFPATLFYYSFRRVVHDIHYASCTALPKVVNHSVVIIFLCGSLFSRPHRGDFHFPGPLYFETPLELLILAAFIFGCSRRGSGGSKFIWGIKIEGVAKSTEADLGGGCRGCAPPPLRWPAVF